MAWLEGWDKRRIKFTTDYTKVGPNIETFLASGIWTCPVGVTSVQVECWGAGGGGGGCFFIDAKGAGGGGGGGAYSKKNTYAVTPTNTYNYFVGAKGAVTASADGGVGGDSYWVVQDASSCSAKGGGGGKVGTNTAQGAGGAGGALADGFGDTKYSGGAGFGGGVINGVGGGGGEGAATNVNGNAATSQAGGTGTDGGDGGAGGANHVVGSPATNGSGGAGGGAGHRSGTNLAGGLGNIGKVAITYTGVPLTWFSVTVTLSSTQMVKVFTELTSDDNRFKIAFTDTDGDWQLYGEIELWDTANQKVIIHVSRADWEISDIENTDFYMYYDKDHADNTDYIGDKGLAGRDGPRENVWDDNFIMVQHNADETTSTITDSTRNNNDGTKKGAGEPASAAGKVGLAQDFDGTDNYIDVGKLASLFDDANSVATFEYICKPDASATKPYVFWTSNYMDEHAQFRGFMDDAANANLITFLVNIGKWPLNYSYIYSSATAISDGTWYQVSAVLNLGTLANSLIYVDGAVKVTSTATAGTPPVVYPSLNSNFRIAGDATYNFDGIIDEIRISNIARTAGWIKATYNSLWDTLLTYGDEETAGILLEFSETLSIADTMTTSGTLAKAETLSIVDTKIMSGSLGFIETLSIVDSWSALITFFETLSITDSKFLTGTLELDETLEIVDSATYQCIKTFYETLSIIDTITTSGSLNLAETLSIADSWTVLKTFFETLSITDTVAMGGSLNVSEIISIIDSFIRWIEHPIYTEEIKSDVSWIKETKPAGISATEEEKPTISWLEEIKPDGISAIEETKGTISYEEETKKIKLD